MTATAFNLWSIVIQCFAVVVSVGVGVVVYCYTKETNLIRKQGQRQLEMLETQLQLGLAPYLIARVIEYLPGGQRVPHTAIANIKASQVCRLWNPTDRPAHHLNVLVHSGGGKYFWSDDCFDVFGRSEPGADHRVAARGPLTHDEAIRQIRLEYKDEAGQYLHVVQEQRGFLAVFFRDINANLYLALRLVDFDGPGEKAVAHWTNRVLRPFG